MSSAEGAGQALGVGRRVNFARKTALERELALPMIPIETLNSSPDMPALSLISDSGGPPAGNGAGRRLTAIAFADIVGYSILMSEDEAGTHRRWMALLANVVRPGAARHRGRIVKSTGDGVLAEFPSALEAVEWAREVQEAVHREESAEVRPIALRIAVHVGEVMTTADDIYGDGVNITARLQEYAEPGGIILSEIAYNLVRDAYAAQARDLGYLNLKNFERPFRAYGIAGPRSSASCMLPPPERNHSPKQTVKLS